MVKLESKCLNKRRKSNRKRLNVEDKRKKKLLKLEKEKDVRNWREKSHPNNHLLVQIDLLSIRITLNLITSHLLGFSITKINLWSQQSRRNLPRKLLHSLVIQMRMKANRLHSFNHHQFNSKHIKLQLKLMIVMVQITTLTITTKRQIFHPMIINRLINLLQLFQVTSNQQRRRTRKRKRRASLITHQMMTMSQAMTTTVMMVKLSQNQSPMHIWLHLKWTRVHRNCHLPCQDSLKSKMSCLLQFTKNNNQLLPNCRTCMVEMMMTMTMISISDNLIVSHCLQLEGKLKCRLNIMQHQLKPRLIHKPNSANYLVMMMMKMTIELQWLLSSK